MKQTAGILLLSHCGYSFMEDLIKSVNELGLESYVLSSQPLNADRVIELNALTPYIKVTNHHVLNQYDIDDYYQQLLLENKNVLACLSVWEGYRHLMAKLNQDVAANDITPQLANLLRDKYQLRKILNTNDLSAIKTDILTSEHFHNNNFTNHFIKPRIGIASYGAFRYQPSLIWDDIKNLKTQMVNDKEYQSIFNNDLDFIIEDYIAGKEFSFEVIAYQQTPYIIAVHEKIAVEEQATTVLESACVSAPISLSKEQIKNATNWIEKLFNILELKHGCYHVEAKFDGNRWEIIEINPRVGGAFISQSVETLTGENLLAMWLKSLIISTPSAVNQYQQYLFNLSTKSDAFYNRNSYTFFRVFFAKQSGTIKSMEVNKNITQPDLIKIFVKNGTKILTQAREVFLAQALWKLSKTKINEFPTILNNSEHLLEMVYE